MELNELVALSTVGSNMTETMVGVKHSLGAFTRNVGVHAQGRFSIRTSTMTKKNRHKDALGKGRLGLRTLNKIVIIKDVLALGRLCLETFRH